MILKHIVKKVELLHLFFLGAALYRFDEAIRLYDKALLINPNSSDAYNRKGITFNFIFLGTALYCLGHYD